MSDRHRPFRSPRPSVFQECIFIERWQSLMNRAPDGDWDDRFAQTLHSLYGARDVPGDNMTRVAASWIMWLGTNVGTCYRREADALAVKLRDSFENGRHLQLQWCIENTRRWGINGGNRTLELITRDDKGVRTIDLMAPHYEMIEHLALWLGQSPEGLKLVRDCDDEIKRTASALDARRRLDSRVAAFVEAAMRAEPCPGGFPGADANDPGPRPRAVAPARKPPVVDHGTLAAQDADEEG